ncbi:hypothetical protein GWI33_016741 [Rhynchophorus ferrugineus]|uniref:Uncharacterized protein n=1 Tax=Rhynchophorus ferrugineus TaxID=354439 RepID=A0A834I167_RHYFE|nr:hypothetical protein GWI33_016741 [Rhynchophorus ferrugineus]
MRRLKDKKQYNGGHVLNILSTFRFLRFLCAAFGLVYLRMDNQTGKLKKLNGKISALYTTVYMVLYLMFFLPAWSHKVDNTRAPLLFQWTTDIFLLVLSLSVFIRVGLGLPLRNVLTAWINLLSDYDQAFQDIGKIFIHVKT